MMPSSASSQKSTAALNTIAKDGGKSHKLSLAGIGGSEGCGLQVIADAEIVNAEQLSKLQGHNAIKLRLDKFRCVTQLISLANAARKSQLAVVLGVPEDDIEMGDTFIADVAVGLGIGQVCGGGLESGEYTSIFNRLSEIQVETESISFVRKHFRT